jgi:hypothetical protein
LNEWQKVFQVVYIEIYHQPISYMADLFIIVVECFFILRHNNDNNDKCAVSYVVSSATIQGAKVS